MREQFTAGLKDAMKTGDKRRVSTIRLITAALKDRDIEARGACLLYTSPSPRD